MVLARMVIFYHTRLTLADQFDDEMDIDLGTFLAYFGFDIISHSLPMI